MSFVKHKGKVFTERSYSLRHGSGIGTIEIKTHSSRYKFQDCTCIVHPNEDRRMKVTCWCPRHEIERESWGDKRADSLDTIVDAFECILEVASGNLYGAVTSCISFALKSIKAFISNHFKPADLVYTYEFSYIPGSILQ